MDLVQILFYVFGGIAIVCSAAVVGMVRSTVVATLCVVATMVSLAGVFVLQSAHLVAAVQVIAYAGGVGVLFLYMVLFYDLRREGLSTGRQRWLRVAGAVLGVLFLQRGLDLLEPLGEAPPLPEGFGGYRELGLALYTDYVLLVEVSALLLTTAIVGSLILTRRKVDR